MDDARRLSATQRRLVELAVPQVRRLAVTLARTVPHASLEDLISAGYEGLVDAALRYDPALGIPFSGFAHYRARGAMIDVARRAAPAIRRRSRALRALEATQVLLESAQSRQPVQQVQSLRERVAAAADLVAQATAAVLLSKLAPVDPHELGDANDSAETRLIEKEALDRVRAAVAACEPQEQELVQALYVDGLTMHELSLRMGCSVSTVSRHHAKVLRALSWRLSGHPVRPEG
jgi:RNA polymerase sigma factor (sigma-70 family)